MTPQTLNKWHTAVNRFAQTAHEWPRFMYEAEKMALELPRLESLHRAERLGLLPEWHQQYIRSEPVVLQDNYLTCCLGIRCQSCPILCALETTLEGDDLDKAKAFTCVAHILMSGGDVMNEGYVLDQSDVMFWQTLHTSLAESCGEEE